MKKIFTFLFVGLASWGFSQSIAHIEPMSVVSGTLEQIGANGELVAEWHVQNISDQTVSVRVRRNVISAVPGSTNYFCWNVCFTETVNVSPNSLAISMAPGEVNTSFYAHYRPNNNAGDTFIEYCFFNGADQMDESCHTVQYSALAAVSVAESDAAPLQLSELSPNPLNGIGTLQYSFKTAPTQAQLVIRNMVGQVVKQTNISGQNGFLLINSEDFKSGVYLYSIVADGKVMTTKRMIVN
jgi:hypothetical protein